MSTDSGDFTDVDEAQPPSECSFSPPPPPKDLNFVYINPLVLPLEDEVELSVSKQTPRSQTGFVQKLYLQQQLRDNAVAFQRRQQEELEMKECTFQPNIRIRSPIRSPEAFLRTQAALETKRKTELEQRMKEKQDQSVRSQTAALRDRPQLSPGTQKILRDKGTRDPLLTRLLSPRRMRELQPEVSYAYHPLVSPKAQKIKRPQDNVFEELYQRKKTVPQPPPPVPFTVKGRSAELVVKQLHREVTKALEESEIAVDGKVTRVQFRALLLKLQFADERDQVMIDACWTEIAGQEAEVEFNRVLRWMEQAVGEYSSETQAKGSRRTKLLFAMMHKNRTGSPSKYHLHEEPPSHQPTINKTSRAMSPRKNFLEALQQYKARHDRYQSLHAQEALSRETLECSFTPKVHKTTGRNPLLRRMKSMSPGPMQVSEHSPRYDILACYGTLLREERRLLPAPDHQYEASKEELTFAPRRFASVSPRRPGPEPLGFERTVKRLQQAKKLRAEAEEFLARGEGLRKQLTKPLVL